MSRFFSLQINKMLVALTADIGQYDPIDAARNGCTGLTAQSRGIVTRLIDQSAMTVIFDGEKNDIGLIVASNIWHVI